MILDYLAYAILITTVILGGFGLFRPRWTMTLLNLAPEGGNQGYSEIRAVNGAMFVGLGLAGLLLPAPAAAVLGFAYLAAAGGRLCSIFLDDSGTRMIWRFVGVEFLFGVLLIASNWSALSS